VTPVNAPGKDIVATYITGDVRDVLATIPDGSVDLVMTSPPFLALRSYLPADHPDKHREIGAEPDPAAFLATLLGLTAEWRRVLAPHGSICVELGDTYSGSGGAGGDYLEGGIREGQQQFAGSGAAMRESNAAHWRAKAANKAAWPLAKSLCGIPHLYHLSLAYGRNLLTGEPCEPWRVRNVVAWCRPNPPVGALGDKFRPATSYLTIACPSAKRYFDLDAVRTAPKDYVPRYGEHKVDGIPRRTGQVANPLGPDGQRIQANAAGAPPLDWWEIPTTPYSGSHYAVYPPALLERPIKAMVPQRVCTVCGEPSRRITGEPTYIGPSGEPMERNEWASGITDGKAAHSNKPDGRGVTRTAETIGWSDCGHGGQWRNGLVLDPFGGSGTTGLVATGNGRDALLIDIDERNVDLARDRIGMFLTHYTLDEWRKEHVPCTPAGT